ncbi:TetR/AcrR family transcriptional regulator [Mycolicibacterium diernhoferi]|uniref:TetR/AcrR family transcriptional regulator n=1 Tax=Mycolicibacterium diernhoferi TaxID=1801 RepID=A0A2A7NU70_9MYCO|nr:TetR/AcrR family transcriptional regulator [Mycolicibacterium diernhoferi]PEG53843.1 TetR/AcrR family transcriptional regulator [Mycolicibacterium diernhoferi]QYL22894.1 TetR/AcrR family transcriptional regulator [Mycolicibacterium diernhoferi]
MAYVSTEERRKQLVAAATRVIREHGVTNATTRRIADEAGAPLASLHYCFRGKDELYEMVMETLGVEGRTRLEESVSPGMGVSAAAAAILRETAAWALHTFEDRLTDYEVSIWAIRSGEFAHIPKKTYRTWIKHLGGLCRQARRDDEPEYDYDALGRMLLTLIDGFIIQHQMLQTRQSSKQADKLVATIQAAIDSGVFNVS